SASRVAFPPTSWAVTPAQVSAVSTKLDLLVIGRTGHAGRGTYERVNGVKFPQRAHQATSATPVSTSILTGVGILGEAGYTLVSPCSQVEMERREPASRCQS